MKWTILALIPLLHFTSTAAAACGETSGDTLEAVWTFYDDILARERRGEINETTYCLSPKGFEAFRDSFLAPSDQLKKLFDYPPDYSIQMEMLSKIICQDGSYQETYSERYGDWYVANYEVGSTREVRHIKTFDRSGELRLTHLSVNARSMSAIWFRFLHDADTSVTLANTPKIDEFVKAEMPQLYQAALDDNYGLCKVTKYLKPDIEAKFEAIEERWRQRSQLDQ